jgi:hypothetical protein
VRIPTALVSAGAAFLLFAAPASAATFSGSCQFSGTITPMPPITVVPRPGPHFDYSGTGACGGQPATLSFADVSTLFDTCELGPDLPLTGTMTIGADRYTVTVDLLRVALAGPFLITTGGGGLGVGVATFTPPGNELDAVEACAGAGIATATLAANFSTIEPLRSS